MTKFAAVVRWSIALSIAAFLSACADTAEKENSGQTKSNSSAKAKSDEEMKHGETPHSQGWINL